MVPVGETKHTRKLIVRHRPDSCKLRLCALLQTLGRVPGTRDGADCIGERTGEADDPPNGFKVDCAVQSLEESR